MNAKQCACAQRTARAHIVCAIAVLFFSPAFANGQIRTVALTGQPAPGRPDNFFSIATAPVVINDAGQVAFSAEFDANSGRRAMFSEGSGSLALVAGPGLPAPGFPDGTTFFSADGGYVNNSGGAVIKGLVLAPTFIRGFWAIESGVLELVAKGGMQAPGLPAGDNFLDGLIAAEFAFNDVGETLFFSTITGPGVDFTNSEGLWSGHPGSLTLLARTGSQAPGTPSGVMFRNLGRSHLNNRGHSAFRGFLSGPGVSDANRDGIWTDRTGSVELVVRSGTQAPGMPTGISLRSVVYDSLNTADQIAFSGRLVGPGVDDSNDQGIWVEDSGNFRLVVREGSAVPGGASGVVFGETSEVVLNDAGHVALVSGLTGSVVDSTNDGGLWREGASGLELVARRGSQAPGVSAGLNFDVFSSPAFNNLGQVAFEATLSGNGIGSANDAGLWATDPAGVLRLIARAGDPLEVAPGDARIVSDLRLTASIVSGAGVPTGLNNKGQVAFAAMFTDGTSGVFVSNLVAVPEPAELELAVVGFAWLLKQRRKVR